MGPIKRNNRNIHAAPQRPIYETEVSIELNEIDFDLLLNTPSDPEFRSFYVGCSDRMVQIFLSDCESDLIQEALLTGELSHEAKYELATVGRLITKLNSNPELLGNPNGYLRYSGGETFESDDRLVSMFGSAMNHRLLGAEEEQILCRAAIYGQDEKAKEILCICNTRLIVTIARKYGRYQMDLADLVQYGRVGFLYGLAMFKPEIGNKLSTYISYWIDQAIDRACINNSADIRLPYNQHDKYIKLNREEEALLEANPAIDLDSKETIKYLTQKLEITKEDISIYRWYRSNKHAVDLDEPYRQDEDLSLGERIPCAEQEDLDEKDTIERQMLLVKKAVEELPPKRQTIFHMRFVMELTLEEIGKNLGMTREGVRQNEVIILNHLRNFLKNREQEM